jgi:alkylation response protein AidB-like acyl-CoA dehydrogenase
MDFRHSDDRRMLADALDRWVAQAYTFDTRMALLKTDAGHSPQLWRQLGELGAIGALFTEAQGGLAGSGFDIAVVCEALGKGLVSEPLLASGVLAGTALAQAGAAQADHPHAPVLAAIQRGEAVATLAHFEAGGHHDPLHIATHAQPTAEGWRLQGHKAVVPFGAQAQWLLVSARTAPLNPALPEGGISLFVLSADTPGLQRQGYPTIDGQQAADLQLDVQLPATALLADPDTANEAGQAWPLIDTALAHGLLALSAESLGAMQSAHRDTIAYLQTRQQFGVPLARFQALQHRVVDMGIAIEQARSAVINAAAALTSHQASPTAAKRAARDKALSAAKYTVGQAGTRVAEEAIQLHGGIGMTWELPVSHVAKRLVMIDHQLGDEDHHLARYIALSQGQGHHGHQGAQ